MVMDKTVVRSISCPQEKRKTDTLEIKKEAAKVALNGTVKGANYGSWGPLFKNSQHFASLHYS